MRSRSASLSWATVATRAKRMMKTISATARHPNVNVHIVRRQRALVSKRVCEVTAPRISLTHFSTRRSPTSTNCNVSKATLASIANRSGGKIALYALQKHAIDDGKFGWNHVAGASEFWSTRDFHTYIREHVNEIAKNLPEDFKEAYFLINNYDEPQSMGVHCVDIDRLRKLHPNVGIVSPSGQAPVWSMSKVRGCHMDILFPFPIISVIFAKERGRETHPHLRGRSAPTTTLRFEARRRDSATRRQIYARGLCPP